MGDGVRAARRQMVIRRRRARRIVVTNSGTWWYLGIFPLQVLNLGCLPAALREAQRAGI